MKRVTQIARRIGLALLALCVACGSKCVAAPLVLYGTATVATAVHGLNPALMSYSPLPLNVAVGDAFSFQLSIDREYSPGTPPGYRTTFTAAIGAADIIDEGLIAHVVNDSLIDPRHIAEFIDLDGGPTPGDAVLLFNRDDVTRNSGRVLSAIAPAFETQLLFVSFLSDQPPSSPVLTDASLPGNPQAWNLFSQREIALSFDNRSYLGAYITSISVVPEPATVSILMMAALALRRNRFFLSRS
jgi:hypothetical protein